MASSTSKKKAKKAKPATSVIVLQRSKKKEIKQWTLTDATNRAKDLNKYRPDGVDPIDLKKDLPRARNKKNDAVKRKEIIKRIRIWEILNIDSDDDDNIDSDDSQTKTKKKTKKKKFKPEPVEPQTSLLAPKTVKKARKSRKRQHANRMWIDIDWLTYNFGTGVPLTQTTLRRPIPGDSRMPRLARHRMARR